jgi:hypothetical protein
MAKREPGRVFNSQNAKILFLPELKGDRQRPGLFFLGKEVWLQNLRWMEMAFIKIIASL